MSINFIFGFIFFPDLAPPFLKVDFLKVDLVLRHMFLEQTTLGADPL